MLDGQPCNDERYCVVALTSLFTGASIRDGLEFFHNYWMYLERVSIIYIKYFNKLTFDV